jgi:hypothetical protein
VSSAVRWRELAAGGVLGRKDTAMKRWGVNPKKWFYGFRDELRSRADEVSLRLAGAAAEQWLNAELFAYLARNLRNSGGLYAYTEWKKHDVTVFSLDPTDPHDYEKKGGIEAILETKLFYTGYKSAKMQGYFDKLITQMERARSSMSKDGSPHGASIGLVLAAYVRWPDRKQETAKQFKQRLLDTGRTHFAKRTLETIIDRRHRDEVHVGALGRPIEVSLYGQYLLLP